MNKIWHGKDEFESLELHNARSKYIEVYTQEVGSFSGMYAKVNLLRHMRNSLKWFFDVNDRTIEEWENECHNILV